MDTARKCFRFVFPLVTLFFTNHTLAEIYKCPQPDGLVKFSDSVCADGKVETVVLFENSPLDNTVERENIVRYRHQQKLGSQRKSDKKVHQAVLIGDTHTSERNARITEREHPKKKRKKKAKKRSKQVAEKNKPTAAEETTN